MQTDTYGDIPVAYYVKGAMPPEENVYIHNLADANGEHAEKGHNPFDDFCIDKTFNYIVHHSTPADNNEIRLSSICTAYNPGWYTSQYVYSDIKNNISDLIETAISIRNCYPK